MKAKNAVKFYYMYQLPWWLSSKESACNAGDTGSVPGLERFRGEGNANWLQYFCQENPMDREASQATAHSVTELDMTEHASTTYIE